MNEPTPPMPASASGSPAPEVARYRDGVRVFQAHAAVAGGAILLILAVNLLTNLSAGTAGDVGAWWALWSLLGWAAGLGVHGFVVWLARPVTEPHDGRAAR